MVRTEGAGASWRLDETRSVIDLDHSGSFPMNTEVEALLTFSSDSESNFNQPDAHTLSIREHHSFLPLPEPGYEVREQDPRVGFFGVTFQDFSQPYDRSLTRYLISRWRLQKKDSNAAVSEPVKPIVFYLDRAIPDSIRPAVRRGALWWNMAFEQAGFKNALASKTCRKALTHSTSAIPPSNGQTALDADGRSGRPRRSTHRRNSPRTGAA